MASWQTLDDLNPDTLLDKMRDLADAGESIAAILDAIVTLLEAIAPLLVFPDNPLKAIINAIIDAVAGFIDDLLSNNIAVCFHSNMKYDTTWRISRRAAQNDPQSSSGKTPNLEDGDIPFKGTGLAGWIGALMSSVRNDADPWAPVQSDDGNCGLVLIIWSFPTPSALQDLIPLIKDFWSNWDDLKWSNYDVSFREENWHSRKHLAGMGSAFGSAWASHTGYSEGGNAWEVIKGGVASKMGEALPLSEGFNPLNMPQPLWRSIPIARIFGPPLQALLEAIRDYLNSLKFPVNDTLKRLVEALARKVKRLSQIIAKIAKLIDQVALLIEAVTTMHIIVIPPAKDTTGASEPFLGNGGINGCLVEALAADGAPDYGADAVVLGLCGLINMDTGMDNFSTLLAVLNGELDQLVAAYSEQFDAVTEAWEGVSDALDDASWNNTAPTVRIPRISPITAEYEQAEGTFTVTDTIPDEFNIIIGTTMVTVIDHMGGTPTPTYIANKMRAAITAHSDLTGVVTAAAVGPVVTITASEAGLAGSNITIASGHVNIETSGLTLNRPAMDLTVDLLAEVSDSDGDSVTYEWVYTSVPTGSSLAEGLTFAVDEDTVFTPDVVGDYKFTLTADDGSDRSSDTITVTIVDEE